MGGLDSSGGDTGGGGRQGRPGRAARGRRRAGGLLLACALLAGCDGPPDPAPVLGDADVARGRELVAAHGCTACHAFPDVPWPRGRVGPPLDGFGTRPLIAGQLPNQPGVLMRFVRDAPALLPGTAMPAVPLTDPEARDVTAYLLQLRAR